MNVAEFILQVNMIYSTIYIQNDIPNYDIGRIVDVAVNFGDGSANFLIKKNEETDIKQLLNICAQSGFASTYYMYKGPVINNCETVILAVNTTERVNNWGRIKRRLTSYTYGYFLLLSKIIEYIDTSRLIEFNSFQFNTASQAITVQSFREINENDISILRNIIASTVLNDKNNIPYGIKISDIDISSKIENRYQNVVITLK